MASLVQLRPAANLVTSTAADAILQRAVLQWSPQGSRGAFSSICRLPAIQQCSPAAVVSHLAAAIQQYNRAAVEVLSQLPAAKLIITAPNLDELLQAAAEQDLLDGGHSPLDAVQSPRWFEATKHHLYGRGLTAAEVEQAAHDDICRGGSSGSGSNSCGGNDTTCSTSSSSSYALDRLIWLLDCLWRKQPAAWTLGRLLTTAVQQQNVLALERICSSARYSSRGGRRPPDSEIVQLLCTVIQQSTQPMQQQQQLIVCNIAAGQLGPDAAGATIANPVRSAAS